MPTRRALVVFQDNLLKGVPGVEADFISTGASITPGPGFAGEPAARPLQTILKALGRLSARRYDYVLLPAVNLAWAHDPPGFKSRLRRVIRAALPSGARRGPAGRKPRIAFIDRYDSTVIYPEVAAALGADIYFKANLGTLLPGDFPFKVESMPYWVFEQNYPSVSGAKETDLFYSASINSPAREYAARELAELARRGVSIDHPAERLPFPEFVARMGRAALTLSPSGMGYHGFRHYEAMLMESVPVLNAGSVKTDLVDGQTCLLYSNGVEGELAGKVVDALKNREALAAWGKRLRDFALENHSAASAGRYVIERLDEIG